MSIQEINHKNEWENFVSNCQPNTFLQSWNMGELHKSLGDKIFRLGVYDENNELRGVAFIVKIVARRGSFLYCPYGPLFKDWLKNCKYFTTLIDYLKKLAKNEKISFIRISPLLEKNKKNVIIFKDNHFHSAPIQVLAETTWLLDITFREEEILKGMRKNTRNLVRRAAKEGVVVTQSKSNEDLETFIKLHRQTVKRHHFTPYTDDYFRAQVNSFRDDDEVRIFIARHKGEVLAAAIVMYYGYQGAYHHAASLGSKIPATYLLQWEAINEAKRRGLKLYNFWGIVENKPKHPWAGLSLFKKGFGGYEMSWLNAQDLAVSPRYWLTYIFETLRRLKRYTF